MFIDYLPSNSYIHSFDIRTKMLCFSCIVVLSFCFDHPLYNLLVLALVGILALVARFPFTKLYHLLLPLGPVFFLIMLFSAFTPPDQFVTPLYQKVIFNVFSFEHIKLTVGGLLHGFTLLVRLITVIIASSLITLTSPIDDLIQLLNKLKVPYEYSFAITTALRFIPTMNKKRMIIVEAQKARGAKLDENSLTGFVNRYVPIMVPMMVNSLRMSNSLSMAMLNRGYGHSAHRTIVREIFFEFRDYIACALILLVAGVGIYLRFILDQGYLH